MSTATIHHEAKQEKKNSPWNCGKIVFLYFISFPCGFEIFVIFNTLLTKQNIWESQEIKYNNTAKFSLKGFTHLYHCNI